jgi:hypothetical protein
MVCVYAYSVIMTKEINPETSGLQINLHLSYASFFSHLLVMTFMTDQYNLTFYDSLKLLFYFGIPWTIS